MKTLDDLSKKIKIAEGHAKEIEEINLNKEEDEKLQRFDLYYLIRLEKYVRQGGDPTFGSWRWQLTSVDSIVNNLLSKPRTETKDDPPARCAEIAYAYADAMLIARSSGLI